MGPRRAQGREQGPCAPAAGRGKGGGRPGGAGRGPVAKGAAVPPGPPGGQRSTRRPWTRSQSRGHRSPPGWADPRVHFLVTGPPAGRTHPSRPLQATAPVLPFPTDPAAPPTEAAALQGETHPCLHLSACPRLCPCVRVSACLHPCLRVRVSACPGAQRQRSLRGWGSVCLPLPLPTPIPPHPPPSHPPTPIPHPHLSPPLHPPNPPTPSTHTLPVTSQRVPEEQSWGPHV